MPPLPARNGYLPIVSAPFPPDARSLFLPLLICFYLPCHTRNLANRVEDMLTKPFVCETKALMISLSALEDKRQHD